LLVAGLSIKDIYYIVNRYIGVTGGYLGDFSYRSHAEFYREYCDLDIDPFVHNGTTRERFIEVLERADARTQATILSGILEKYPVGSDDLRTPESYQHVQELIARCLGDADVGVPALRISSDVVRRAIADADTLMETSGPTSAVDRVHTALHGYLKAACDESEIAHPLETPEPGPADGVPDPGFPCKSLYAGGGTRTRTGIALRCLRDRSGVRRRL
jgi:hypothetical protein